MSLPPLLSELLSLPTAAFVEHAVLTCIERRCASLPGVRTRYDRYGNLLVHCCLPDSTLTAARGEGFPPPRAALTFTAHTDHPGFVALQMRDEKTLVAAFRGWVEPEYFIGTSVRFHTAGRWVRGRVVEVLKAAPVYGMIGRTGRPEEVLVRVEAPVEANAAGMWDLPEPELRGEFVHARGCDDVAGCAALLAMIERVSQRQAACEFYALFTRAEEVGFIGAIAAAREGTIPRGSPVIAIETSKALVHARQGDGPILRVGDRTSVFTPHVTAFCDRVAKDLMKRDPSFSYQRKLMDGGTCESTAYLVYGYPATGICVALGNYHNMDTERACIDTEYIHLGDWCRMVDWFEALATDEQGCGGEDAALRRTLDERFESYRPLLDEHRDRG